VHETQYNFVVSSIEVKRGLFITDNAFIHLLLLPAAAISLSATVAKG
jgi:hypothetical protein